MGRRLELCRHVPLHGVVVEVLSKPEEQEGWKGELLARRALGPSCPPCCCGAKFGTALLRGRACGYPGAGRQRSCFSISKLIML